MGKGYKTASVEYVKENIKRITNGNNLIFFLTFKKISN